MKRRITIAVAALAFALGPWSVLRTIAATGLANNDGPYVINEDTKLVVNAASGVLANDTPAGDTCVLSNMTDTSGLEGQLADGVVEANGTFEFTPTENWIGSTDFTYQMAALDAGSCPSLPEDGALVTITVNPVNDPPFVSTGVDCAVDVEVAEDSDAFGAAPHCVQMQDFGPIFGPGHENDQHFEAWLVSTNKPELFASGPTITLVDEDIPYGRLTFTPAQNANGLATVTVRGRDDGGTANGGDNTSDPTSFTIRITPVNDSPTAQADSFTALPNTTLNVKAPGVLKNDSDIDDDDLTAQKVSNPSHGILNLAADGAFSYTPSAGYLGPDAFSYRASDGDEESAIRVVTLNVTSVPSAPPTVAPPTTSPTAEPSVEPSPSASAEPSGSLEPSASPSLAPSPSASLEPGATPAPEPAGSSGGLSLPVLIVALLLIALLAFGAAIFVPKWIESRRGGGSSGDPGGGYRGSGTG